MRHPGLTCSKPAGRAGARPRATARRLAAAGLGVILGFASAAASAAQVWFCVPQTRPQFMQLFQPDAPWQHAASTVSVYKFYTDFIRGDSSDQMLRDIIADLNRRHIALALEGEQVTKPDNCGGGESYAWKDKTTAFIAERIRRLGGDLRYVAMDEPLFFAHQASGPNACHMPIADLARNVAADVAALKRVFPDVQVGDIEPVGVTDPGWVAAILQWTQAYRQATGQPLAFFHMDMTWGPLAFEQARAIVPRLRQGGIGYGVIYDASSDDRTDLAWTHRAEEHFVEVESDPALVPDQAIVQTWSPNPVQLLPETQPGTMTWLLDRYHAAPTRLALRRAGNRLDGELTDGAGHPLAGAAVALSALQAGAPGDPAMHTASGKVPAKAASATLVLRVNTECACSGPADVAVGAMRFRDDRTGQAVQQAFHLPPAAGVAGPMAVRVMARPGQAIGQNTPSFPVTPDDPYTLQVPMTADAASADSGYVGVVFLDAGGKEIQRDKLGFAPTDHGLGTVTTDAQGRFAVSIPGAALAGAVGFKAQFAGDPQHRLSMATLR